MTQLGYMTSKLLDRINLKNVDIQMTNFSLYFRIFIFPSSFNVG